MKLDLVRNDPVPLYRQIAVCLQSLIEDGVLVPGTQLPTVRRMAQRQGVGRLTVQTAYAELQAQGWIESVVGRGTFVAEKALVVEIPSAILPRVETRGSLAALLETQECPTRLLLAQAAPPEETFPVRSFKACLGTALQKTSNLAYGPVQGEESLRSQVSRLLLSRGLAVSPDSILVTSGAQQAIDLTVRTLTNPEQAVMIEAPTYPGILGLLSSRQQRHQEVPMLSDGVCLSTLERLCERDRPALFYTIPTFHNPTGTVTSKEHRLKLLDLAEKYDFFVIEDDVYGHLSLDRPAPPCLRSFDDRGRVIYVTSFSKSVMPSLRLGALVATRAQLDALNRRKQATDLISSSLLQVAMAEFLKRGHFETHLRKVKELYRTRRDAACRVIEELLPECQFSSPQGGLSLWLQLPTEVNEAQLFEEARRMGVLVAQGEAFFSRSQPRGYLRLTFTTLNKPMFRQAVAVLAKLLEKQKKINEAPRKSALII